MATAPLPAESACATPADELHEAGLFIQARLGQIATLLTAIDDASEDIQHGSNVTGALGRIVDLVTLGREIATQAIDRAERVEVLGMRLSHV